MGILEHGGKTPRIAPSAFLAEGVSLIGDVIVGTEASIWFNAVLRGDINTIDVGDRTNIQDGSVIHVTHENAVKIGADVTVGHRVVIHGCTVGDSCLIGMGAIVLDNAKVGSFSLVAAGAVVLENFEVPEGMLVAGVPARIIRPLTTQEKDQILGSAKHYVGYARSYRT